MRTTAPPRRAKAVAAVRPPTPPPTTNTRRISLMGGGLCAVCLAQRSGAALGLTVYLTIASIEFFAKRAWTLSEAGDLQHRQDSHWRYRVAGGRRRYHH